jgi:hypothetical protein
MATGLLAADAEVAESEAAVKVPEKTAVAEKAMVAMAGACAEVAATEEAAEVVATVLGTEVAGMVAVDSAAAAGARVREMVGATAVS